MNILYQGYYITNYYNAQKWHSSQYTKFYCLPYIHVQAWGIYSIMTCLGGDNLGKLYFANKNEIKSLSYHNRVCSSTFDINCALARIFRFLSLTGLINLFLLSRAVSMMKEGMLSCWIQWSCSKLLTTRLCLSCWIQWSCSKPLTTRLCLSCLLQWSCSQLRMMRVCHHRNHSVKTLTWTVMPLSHVVLHQPLNIVSHSPA